MKSNFLSEKGGEVPEMIIIGKFIIQKYSIGTLVHPPWVSDDDNDSIVLT